MRALVGVVRAGAVAATLGAAVAVANRLTLPRLAPGAVVDEPVTVIVPARNEARRLPPLVADLRAQRGLRRLRVVIFDDDSVDGTTEAARLAAGDDPRVTVIRSTAPPPPGWTGKAAACARAYAATDPSGVVAFVDADVRLAPGAVAAAVTVLRDRRAHLLTPWPFQQAGSAAERLVQPLLFWSWFATLPIAVSHRSNRPSMAVSCGQFLVFDASAYAAVGGHVAVAASPTEDLDLARALRRSGRRTMVAAAGNLASCRMYEGAAPLRAGYTRWLWSAFGSPAGSAAVLVAAAVTYVLPPVAVVLGPGPARRWGVVGTAAAIVSRTVARATERGSPDRSDVAAGCTHPFAVCAFAALAIDSLRARRTGRLGWKDRPLP